MPLLGLSRPATQATQDLDAAYRQHSKFDFASPKTELTNLYVSPTLEYQENLPQK